MAKGLKWNEAMREAGFFLFTETFSVRIKVEKKLHIIMVTQALPRKQKVTAQIITKLEGINVEIYKDDPLP